jgi:hypothetical protein
MTSYGKDDSSQSAFLTALRSTKAVSGSTHTYYRYPARFSPEFAREAIGLFTVPGDTVLDPFMGGGTSAVEAIASGRHFVGSDINHIATFVSRVKTTLLSRVDAEKIGEWANEARDSIDLVRAERCAGEWERCQNHIPWRTRRLLAQLLESIDELDTERQKQFARCSILSLGQWALDCKSHLPSKGALLVAHSEIVARMLRGNQELRERVRASHGSVQGAGCRLYCADASILHRKHDVERFGRPKLILTSPPYLGVHVLYHRWQILGRRETSAPYWIVNKPDGHGGSFYTFADRKSSGPDQYLSKLRACFSSITALMGRGTLVAQLVAFPDADVQLPFYLRALADVGLQHCECISASKKGTTITRDVPNRRWYALTSKQSHSSREFLLIHRLANGKSRYP